MLQTVNKSPFDSHSLQTCLGLAKSGSDILLIEDAVYAAMSGTAVTSMVEAAMASSTIYALEPDLKARGIGSEKMISGINLVGYDGFVELAVTNDKVQSWL